MRSVFSTDDYKPADRYAAWKEAICNVYVHVDVAANRPESYRGSVSEARFGDTVLTDIALADQRIARGRTHLAQLDKDCYYVQLLQHGRLEVRQRGQAHVSNLARGAIFSASEEYELRTGGDIRAYYLELPRDSFALRFPGGTAPVSAPINTAVGLGRIAVELCALLAAEGPHLDAAASARLGEQMMDILALSLQAGPHDLPEMESAVTTARLGAVKTWIEAHLFDPALSPERIATANGMSLRSLHLLFRQGDTTVSTWVRNRRLQRAYDSLLRGDVSSITMLALEHGFNSSSHFATSFRNRYGLSPREAAHGGTERD
ncbi:AraC-like ligand-binding domain-containing protein [Acidimangrovimonas sediminis]|uniref:AraC-like ligand-binding domain-containing protein n=1 Tax=Acidimangrovimonas sediminis TaxID=2056283 RepID=UPI000C80FC44|nr:helix-turn-helix domain-containing protein [Acidimangrovimonas sediminis]